MSNILNDTDAPVIIRPIPELYRTVLLPQINFMTNDKLIVHKKSIYYINFYLSKLIFLSY